MITFETEILKFGQMGEKTGWSYIEIPEAIAEQLSAGNKKSFRVKGAIDNLKIKQVALLPMGDGNFIMPLNAFMRKGIRKNKGAIVKVSLLADHSPLKICDELLQCLQEEPDAKTFFESLPPSHQHYYSKWIESAKTDATKTKRIAQALNAFVKHQSYSEMMRANKANKQP
jgi:hypothetical protein